MVLVLFSLQFRVKGMCSYLGLYPYFWFKKAEFEKYKIRKANIKRNKIKVRAGIIITAETPNFPWILRDHSQPKRKHSECNLLSFWVNEILIGPNSWNWISRRTSQNFKKLKSDWNDHSPNDKLNDLKHKKRVNHRAKPGNRFRLQIFC